MKSDHLAVELVIQTASGVLTGRFGPREAVTILASQAPQARGEAQLLIGRDPQQSGAYAQLLGSIAAELAARVEGHDEARDMRAVLSELDRLVRALTA
ncbi:MAG: hypothetical protein LC733_01180 [Actinobacteria bacterium]|nr:hypothetical protein [Actinomycetota bacterium]